MRNACSETSNRIFIPIRRAPADALAGLGNALIMCSTQPHNMVKDRTGINRQPNSDLVGMRQTSVGVFPVSRSPAGYSQASAPLYASRDRGTYLVVQVYFPVRAPPSPLWIWMPPSPFCARRVPPCVLIRSDEYTRNDVSTL